MSGTKSKGFDLNYYQEDFTEDNYRNLLNIAQKSYDFKKFTDIQSSTPIILWRHDIDFSMHRAYQLAKIEHDEGVQATYFLQLNCKFYNLFETEIKEKVIDILSLGHSIGLHFDPTAYKITNQEDLENRLTFEKEILEQLFNVTIHVFSFHNPTPEITKFDHLKLAGMLNTYARIFKDEFHYCSDSNGYWRHERLEDVLKSAKYDKLQILTHPAWWQKEIMSPQQRIQRCIDGRTTAIEASYNMLLKQHGRENIG